MKTQIKLTVDLRDEYGYGEIVEPSGTILNFVSDEGNYIFAEAVDGSVTYAIEPDEYEWVLMPLRASGLSGD